MVAKREKLFTMNDTREIHLSSLAVYFPKEEIYTQKM